MIGYFIGKALGKFTKVPVKDGLMFFKEIPYADKIKDIAHETHRVHIDYITSLAQEAARRHDLQALRVIYRYARTQDYGTQFMNLLIKLGQETKLYHHLGNPFSMIEEVAKALC